MPRPTSSTFVRVESTANWLMDDEPVAALPLAVRVLIAEYRDGLVRRADDTPLVVGAPGSRFDLLLWRHQNVGGQRGLSDKAAHVAAVVHLVVAQSRLERLLCALTPQAT